MQVFTVHTGCRHEGGSTKVVCASLDIARRFAKNYARKDQSRRRKWKSRYIEIEPNYWLEYFKSQRYDRAWGEGSSIIVITEVKVYS